jgi:hypothetical protein
MHLEVIKALRERIHPSLVAKNYHGFDYIKSHTVIDRLIQVAGDVGWEFRILDTKVSYDAQGSPTHVAMLGQLTVSGESRQDWGEAWPSKDQSELFKSCQSDTLKRCGRMFGIALELYGELVDEGTGEVTGRASAPVQPRHIGEQYPSRPTPSGGSYQQGERKTYPSPKQTTAFAIPTAAEAGLDWEQQQDDIIFAALGKKGPLYRNDEFQDVVAWMQGHKGMEGQWQYDSEGHLVLGPAPPFTTRQTIDDVPWPEEQFIPEER